MKHPGKHLILVGLLATFALGAGAQAPTQAPAPPAARAAAQEHHGRFDPARLQERMARRQALLKQKLQITPAQEAAWTAYAAAMTPPAGFTRPERGDFERLTTPERIDRMRTLRATRAAEMDRRGEATKTFYAALSSEQKKLFDDMSLRRGHGHGRHHGGFGPRAG
ncbi:MAG: Spy/CpxP family protein refolding chaperone [Ramlibacter sp.]|nr:Spy/CpxP family protein refolding chaperone [Ramlibacter sp.]